MHELGHAFGLNHVESSTDAHLDGASISTSASTDRSSTTSAASRACTATRSRNPTAALGNGTPARATSLGSLATGGTLADRFRRGRRPVGESTETDFVSIANASDADFFSFTVAAPAMLDATLTPLGGIFNQGLEGASEVVVRRQRPQRSRPVALRSERHDAARHRRRLAGAGGLESLNGIDLTDAGQYFARVTGAANNLQLYQLRALAAGARHDALRRLQPRRRRRCRRLLRVADTLGQAGSNLAADGNGNGRVDAADYGIWKSNFGASSGSGSIAGGGSVPEPAGITLLSLAALVAPRRRRRPNRRAAWHSR